MKEGKRFQGHYHLGYRNEGLVGCRKREWKLLKVGQHIGFTVGIHSSFPYQLPPRLPDTLMHARMQLPALEVVGGSKAELAN